MKGCQMLIKAKDSWESSLGMVVGAQFAAGMSISRLAADWELTPEDVEELVRRELLRHVPRRNGGAKPPRREVSVMRGSIPKRVNAPLLFGED